MVVSTKQYCCVCGDKFNNDDYSYWQFTTGYQANEVGVPEKVHTKCRFDEKDGKIIGILEGYEVFNHKPIE